MWHFLYDVNICILIFVITFEKRYLHKYIIINYCTSGVDTDSRY